MSWAAWVGYCEGSGAWGGQASGRYQQKHQLVLPNEYHEHESIIAESAYNVSQHVDTAGPVY